MNETIQATPVDLSAIPHDMKVKMAENYMKRLPQVFIPVQHFIGHGMVTRVMMVPAGTAIIGKEHLQGQHNFLMLGTIELETENGPVRLTAPDIIVSGPGKKAAIAITDVVWATTLATDLSDPSDIERLLLASDDEPMKIQQEQQP